MQYTHLVLNHLPKCAGSSLRHSFYEACKNNTYFSEHNIYISMLTHGNISLHRDKECIPAIHKGTKMFIDHSITNFIEDKFLLNYEKTYRIFTMRDPIKRFISHSLFFEKKHPNDLDTEELDRFIFKFGFSAIEMLSNYLYNKETIENKLEIAKKEVKKYNFIFFQETFEECINNFNALNPFSLKLSNVKNNLSNNDDVKLKKNIEKYLENNLKFEIELYEYSMCKKP
jgi:hypothetical protein